MEQIYTLTDPTDNLIKYVGKSKNINERFIRHCSPSNNSNGKEKQEWIKTLRKLGLKPILDIIETGGFEEENFWINQFRAWGFPLFNIHYSNLHIKISNGRKGLKQTNECKNKLRAINSNGTYIAFADSEQLATGISTKEVGEKIGISTTTAHRVFKTGKTINIKSTNTKGVRIVLIPK